MKAYLLFGFLLIQELTHIQLIQMLSFDASEKVSKLKLVVKGDSDLKGERDFIADLHNDICIENLQVCLENLTVENDVNYDLQKIESFDGYTR